MFNKFRTLEQIQGSFTQAVEELKNLRFRNAGVASKNETQISILSQRNEELRAESAKAERFQQNLEKLIGE